ncbi:MAG: methylenetetrahydrofolate reductase [Pseudomonadota bacterium]|nr:methylenetetrahydrofolate reductase [Pseudomonadota bacterium]
MSTLQQKLASGRFVITAEVTPPLSASAGDLMTRVAPLAGLVDAVNVTDAARARAALSSLAASALLAREGIEPICQLTCRDRNRIALIGDVLGAAAQGVRNLLILHGDAPTAGDLPETKSVHDLDSRALMSLIRDMRDKAVLPSGRAIAQPPDSFIGCAETPLDPPPGWKPEALQAKLAAGAQFVQTQFCFDAAMARRYVARLTEAGIVGRLHLILGTGVLTSAKQARFLREKLFGVSIPADLITRLDRSADARSEGQIIAAELVREFRTIAGIAGVHLMAPLQSADAIAEVVKAVAAE